MRAGRGALNLHKRAAGGGAGLTRTLVGVLALSAALERHADDGAAATNAATNVEGYLRAYADSSYAGPLDIM